jgi:hypothetical protein
MKAVDARHGSVEAQNGSRIRIRILIKVKRGIRIHIKVLRVRDPGCGKWKIYYSLTILGPS